MFKKLKDKIGEEFKQAPLKFPVSVQQLAQVISPSQSVNSLTDNNASSSLSYPTDVSNVSTDFFSIGDDDDTQDGLNKTPLTLHNVDLTASSPSNMTHNMSRSRRSSISSVTSDASSLFPIYESGLGSHFFQSDLESEMEDGTSGQLEKVSKEQLYQSFKKVLNRYNKYKGRYVDLAKLYKELQHDNIKTKNVLQESQDKALRRMAELREQCQLEQKAKAHLEESLRNDMEERDHIIDTLKTKISLLSSGGDGSLLIDLESDKKPDFGPEEVTYLRSQNEELLKEVERLKRIKETACHLIDQYDTTINEAPEDLKSDNLKQKLSELKMDIQKMKSENESLSNLLSRNIITEDDRRSQGSGDAGIISDLSTSESSQCDQKLDEKEKKIEKLNNLLLKCKEKINGLNSEIKAKNLIIEDNNKRMKELIEEVQLIKTREEENALSVAENKKAIHEELNAKEEQIKALTKELKTKGNEFIKQKEETIKIYEDKIRDLNNDFNKEMKIKTEQNKKLMEDLKANEIVRGSLERMKCMEESYVSLMEFIKHKSSMFEEFAESKTMEIEKAQKKLEHRVAAVRKNITELIQLKKPLKEPVSEEEIFKQQRVSEVQGVLKNPNIEASENFHIVEKLKSDVMNLSKKVEMLESELAMARNQVQVEKEEGETWKERHTNIEMECEKLKVEFQKKLNENQELGKALTNKNEEIEKIETEKEILRKASCENVEVESKLKEYMDKYNKLQEENRTLENDLTEKYKKLLKEINESKEKVKSLEGEGKAKAKELEVAKKKHLNEIKKKTTENEKLKDELEHLKNEISSKDENFKEELEKVKKNNEMLLLENQNIKRDFEEKEEMIKSLKFEIENINKQSMSGKDTETELRLQLETFRHKFSEVEELNGKLKQECHLLMAEMENVKKNHSGVEKKLKSELDTCVKENDDLKVRLQNILSDFEKEKEINKKEFNDLSRKCESLNAENESLKLEQRLENNLKNESLSEVDKLKARLIESENAAEKLIEDVNILTSNKNEILGDLQLKQNEIDALKNSIACLREELDKKEKIFEEEKCRIRLESENKIKVLKDEIEFINSKHEEDIGSFEKNLNSEMEEANEKMVIAERASAELLEKLEHITNERDELKMAEEEKNLKISELENCLTALKTELDEKFNGDAKEEEKKNEKRNAEIKEIKMQYEKKIGERDNKIEDLQMKISGLEDLEDSTTKHRDEIKQIIMQYDAEISRRDDEIESFKSKFSEYDQVLESLNSAKQEVKMLKTELSEKESIIQRKLDSERKQTVENDEKVEVRSGQENFLLEEKLVAAEQKIFFLEQQLKDQKLEFEVLLDTMKSETEMRIERLRNEKEELLEDERKKWEKEFTAEINEKKTKELNLQRKNEIGNQVEMTRGDRIFENVELDCISKNTSTVESGSSSIEVLQKQLIQQAAEMKELKKLHKKEILELKKMLSFKKKSRRNSTSDNDWFSGGLENDTEHEYLRNILYEYMMGKEQLVLAKVLSAIVKFNDEQTHNVLEKEQQRQTLLGQLGLL